LSRSYIPPHPAPCHRVRWQTDEPGLVGAGVGAAVGAASGSLAVTGSAGLLVAIVGGLVGAGIGYMAEKQMKDRDGIEYVPEMDDGRLVVQNRESDEQPLPDGARVLVQLNGQYTRIMAHPAVDYNADAGGWVDPDSAGTAPVPVHGQASPSRAGGTFCSRAVTWSSNRASPRRR
jgi:hypothetical protein